MYETKKQTTALSKDWRNDVSHKRGCDCTSFAPQNKQEENMLVAFTIILVALIIAVSTLIYEYMKFCSDNRTGMFAHPKYDTRIGQLEDRISRLEVILETEGE